MTAICVPSELRTVRTTAITRELRAASIMVERALALDPNSAWAWNRSGWVRNYLNEPEVAIQHFERSMRLSPFDPMNFNCFAGLGEAHFRAARYDQSVYWFEKALLTNPAAIWVNRILAPAYVFADRQSDAERSIEVLLAEYPGLTIHDVAAAHAFGGDVVKRMAEGLRTAGLPE